MKQLVRPALAAVALATAATALPADARVVRPVELTETTSIVTSTSGWVDVVLPEDVVMSPKHEGNPDVTISGRGRYLGIELYRLGGDIWSSASSLTSYRLPAFQGGTTLTYGSGAPDPECEDELVPGDPLPEDCTYGEQTQIELLQGRYRLWVVADGAPVTITLRLEGLDAGDTRLRPVHRLRSLQQPLPAREAQGDEVVTYGADGLDGHPWGKVFATAAVTGKGVVDAVSVCGRQDSDGTPPFAYGYRCPGGTSGNDELTVRAAGQEHQTWSGYVTSGYGDEDAPLGLGGSFTSTDGAVLGETLGVWMDPPPQ